MIDGISDLGMAEGEGGEEAREVMWRWGMAVGVEEGRAVGE